MYIFALTGAFSVTTLSAVVSVQIKRYDALLEGSLRRDGSEYMKRYDALREGRLRRHGSEYIKRYDALLEGSLRPHGSEYIKRYDALLEGSLRRHGSSNLISSLFTLFTLDSYFHLNLSPHLISSPFFSF